MKKNGCIIEFKCFYDDERQCRYYNKETGTIYNKCKHRSHDDGICLNKAAQREAMKLKTRWTSKPAKKEGFYWLKMPSGTKMIGDLVDCELQHWTCTVADGIETWKNLSKLGYKRSVKPIKED